MASSPPEYCRLFAQKKAYQWGGGGSRAPQDPLATPLNRPSISVLKSSMAGNKKNVSLHTWSIFPSQIVRPRKNYRSLIEEQRVFQIWLWGTKTRRVTVDSTWRSINNCEPMKTGGEQGVRRFGWNPGRFRKNLSSVKRLKNYCFASKVYIYIYIYIYS